MDADAIYEMYQSGISCYEIGRKLRLHRTTVQDKLRRAGFRLRTHQEAIDLRYNQCQDSKVQEVSPMNTDDFQWFEVGNRWIFQKADKRKFIQAGAINKLGCGWYGWSVLGADKTIIHFGACPTLDEAKIQVENNLKGE